VGLANKIALAGAAFRPKCEPDPLYFEGLYFDDSPGFV